MWWVVSHFVTIYVFLFINPHTRNVHACVLCTCVICAVSFLLGFHSFVRLVFLPALLCTTEFIWMGNPYFRFDDDFVLLGTSWRIAHFNFVFLLILLYNLRYAASISIVNNRFHMLYAFTYSYRRYIHTHGRLW